MKSFQDIKIGRRLAIIMCFAFILIFITETTGLVNNRRLSNEISLGYEAITLPLKFIANARGEFNAMRTNLQNLALDFNTREENQRFRANIERNLANFEENIRQYKRVLDTHGTNAEYEREAVYYLYEMLPSLREYVLYIISYAEQTGFEAHSTRLMRGDFYDVAEDISLELLLLTDILEAQSNDANLRASIQFRESVIMFVVILIMSMVILTFSALIFARSIIKPLNVVTGVALELSNGNLDTVELDYHSKSELGILADSFRYMIHGLKAREIMVSGITYASKIQKNLLPPLSIFEETFADYSIIWEPRDIVGGDIYWAKKYDNGTVLCVADCTGHGTPGALLTMLVVSALESTLLPDNCHDTASIIWHLDQKIVSAMNVNDDGVVSMDINDGCDLAVLFIANDGTVTISAGNTCVFVCDGTEVIRHKGQSIFVGEGKIASKDEINTITIPANPDNKFYIASDGISDQIGGERNKRYGYKEFKHIILENHNEPQAIISGKIWNAFIEYQGEEPRRDDVELITFKPGTGGL